MDGQIKGQLRQTINVAAYSGVSTRGDPSYAAAAAVLARVEDVTEEGDGAGGSMVRSRKLVIVESRIGLQDRIWLPGDSTSDATLARSPERVSVQVDEKGNVDHYEVVL